MALAVEKQVAVEAKATHDANGGDKKSEEYKKSATSNLNQPIKRKDREPTSAAKARGFLVKSWSEQIPQEGR